MNGRRVKVLRKYGLALWGSNVQLRNSFRGRFSHFFRRLKKEWTRNHFSLTPAT